MLKQFEDLRRKVLQLEQLSDELEKRISQHQNQNNKEWLSVLKNSRLDIAEIKANVDILPNLYEEIIEKENFIFEKNQLKKIEKFKKKKNKFLDSIDGLAKICEMLEDSIRNTISQI